MFIWINVFKCICIIYVYTCKTRRGSFTHVQVLLSKKLLHHLKWCQGASFTEHRLLQWQTKQYKTKGLSRFLGGNAGAPNLQISMDTNKQTSKQTNTRASYAADFKHNYSIQRWSQPLNKDSASGGDKKNNNKKTISWANIFIVWPALLVIYSFCAFQVFWDRFLQQNMTEKLTELKLLNQHVSLFCLGTCTCKGGSRARILLLGPHRVCGIMYHDSQKNSQ